MCISSTGTYGHAIPSEDLYDLQVSQSVVCLWGPDCTVFCTWHITKDLHLLKYGIFVLSLKHPGRIHFCTQKSLKCHLFVFQQKFVLNTKMISVMSGSQDGSTNKMIMGAPESLSTVILRVTTHYRIFAAFS